MQSARKSCYTWHICISNGTLMPHDASSMTGASDLAIWNTWRAHAICALRACDPKVSIWRSKKNNWTNSGKKGRKCGSLPSQHWLTASYSHPATKLFERQTCGCIYLWRLWQCHFVASCGCQCHSRMKTVSAMSSLWVTMSLYVTMYTSEISLGSSSTNWGETAMCYPALADLAWKPVNELISAWGHI